MPKIADSLKILTDKVKYFALINFDILNLQEKNCILNLLKKKILEKLVKWKNMLN